MANLVMDRGPMEETPEGINRFWDIDETHWAYAHMMEAAVTHDDWHEQTPAEESDELNMIVSRYVDVNGDKIADNTIAYTDDLEYPEIEGYVHQGYVVVITYTYVAGAADASVTKPKRTQHRLNQTHQEDA